MSKLPVALGLYSVRGTLFSDMPATLAKVKQMGYDGVEFYGPFSFAPSAVVSALEANQLRICGWHMGIESLEGINFDATVAYMKAVGVDNLVVPYLDAKDADGWLDWAKRLSAIAEKLKPLGMHLGYHNHAHEFANLVDGKRPWDILFDNMCPCVFPQIDTGNGFQGGMNLADELTKYQGRLRTIHFKPCKTGAPDHGHDALFDDDDHDLKKEVALAEQGGASWLIIEFESERTYTQMGGAREALRTFKAAL